MTVYESDLPGVGKKYEIELEDGERLVVVTHNTGKREVFLKPEADADSDKLFELSDRLARTVGTILEGAYFQPVETERVETLLTEGTYIEWYSVASDGELAGQTIGDARIREETGVSIIAIQRDDEVITPPTPETRIEVGDTLVVVGSREDCKEFEKRLGSSDEQ
ncbi:cation:proton antiporter regulatory subunit [Natribaculum luteum]|uniref:Cation:proton antiporter regulatory subunit n=1 Tax=Natribaculum luteum TaxID=1586232 RepID=A0ABD5P5R7_9EURY|nr:TrkA C-terminal domain-containing protein [Natribaculum luteum]